MENVRRGNLYAEPNQNDTNISNNNNKNEAQSRIYLENRLLRIR